MNNQTIDISDLPITERLTFARKLGASQGNPVLFNGCVVTNNKSAKSQADALANAPAAFRLTKARMAAAPKKPEHTEQAGYFDGSGFVILNDSIGVF